MTESSQNVRGKEQNEPAWYTLGVEEVGDKVPADLRLFRTKGLRIDEAAHDRRIGSSGKIDRTG